MLPNYTTVEGATEIRPPSVKEKFHMAEENSFDPYVFAIVGIDAAIGAGQGSVGYDRRYGMALADNSIGNFMTTAVLPSALRQDPRYFELGEGGELHTMAYAQSRTVLTRGPSGSRQFNLSEIGGNALAAGVSNLYYPAGARTLTSTVTRWGTQVMWDALERFRFSCSNAVAAMPDVVRALVGHESARAAAINAMTWSKVRGR